VTEAVEVSKKSGIAEVDVVELVVVAWAGEITVKVDEPKSPVGLPVAVTV